MVQVAQRIDCWVRFDIPFSWSAKWEIKEMRNDVGVGSDFYVCHIYVAQVPHKSPISADPGQLDEALVVAM